MNKTKKGIVIFAALFLIIGCAKTYKPYEPQADLQEVNGQKMLLGELQYRDILHYFPEWQIVDQNSEIDPSLAEGIKQINTPVEIACYLGTWCGDSREGVPVFMKTLDTAQNRNIKLTLVGVDRQKIDPRQTALQYNIQRVPTFIVSREGQEIGRMVEFPMKENFAEDLLDILNSN